MICFIFYFLFYANPLPSSIPPPLNLHNRQVHDCVAGDKEGLLEGVDAVIMEAEVEMEDVVDLSNKLNNQTVHARYRGRRMTAAATDGR